MSDRVTSKDVARYAGVSQATVSRVFSGNSASVTPETQSAVLHSARALGYRPNVIGRMMRTRQTHIVGIVMANITNPFYPYVLEKFLQRLQQMERQVLLFTAAPEQSVDDLLPLALQHQVQALIITSATLSSAMIAECARAETPVILFNRTVTGESISAVCADNLAGGRMVAELLWETGHRHFAYITGEPDTSTQVDRYRGYRDALAERGITQIALEHGVYTYESGYRAAQTLLRQASRPDALFCANDITAIGAMDGARDLGLSVPHDISIVGYDDIPMAAWGAYQLTTVSQEVDVMIETTLEMLIRRVADPHALPELRLIAGRLKLRSSIQPRSKG